MENILYNLEIAICNVILHIDRPFKISQLFEEAAKQGIMDQNLILDVLSQLCERGIIKYSEIENDVWAYRKVVDFI